MQVFAWDTTNNSYDYDETDGRSYISAISEIVTDANETCEGNAKNTMGEARMDIVNSEMGYLGFHDSESYGLTWKVSLALLGCYNRGPGECPSCTMTTLYRSTSMISLGYDLRLMGARTIEFPWYGA